MTEEIIIDGVNVAGCEYFAKQNEHSCLEEDGNCKNISDCYYKQLKRLEQENKELKEKIIELSEEKGHLIVENNTLKEQLREDKILDEEIQSLSREDKYKSALEEIRGYFLNPNSNLELQTRQVMLNKINEVLQEDD